MGSRKADEIRQLNETELANRLADAKRELTDVRFRLATRQTENTAQLKNAKRQLARLLTIIQEREQEA